MQERVDASLNNFYIFNPTFGTTEGEVSMLSKSNFYYFIYLYSFMYLISFPQEENKILFFHPPDSDTNNQIKTVGLSEAIIKFTRCVCLPSVVTQLLLCSIGAIF